MMDRIEQIMSGYSTESEIYWFLLELKQRRESDLRPADKYLGNKPWEQWDHLTSEFYEIREEYSKYLIDLSDEGFIEELIDLQMSAETLLATLGLNEQQRREARSKVIQKNEARGYYRKEAE